ncbi:hypothetical protein QBC35DRAFT_45267 [Podospora australis]|uniref:Uncharacterized protein n=1 Tax=Podospora australis TaxID=1536484 RepID=A0AAN7ALY6_9PEZI|nr:hypothetical protein QBC35DRAFT_45267 [Podospora australis]
MQRWPLRSGRWHPSLRPKTSCRWYSIEHVRVKCRSAGEVTVSLHNIAKHPSRTPLAIMIPPLPSPASQADPDTPVPRWLQDHPAAVINYRWDPVQPADPDHPEDLPPKSPLIWPTPIHDISFAYAWLSSNLGLQPKLGDATRDPPLRAAYVYGSYLGATLAAGLALTESHHPSLLADPILRANTHHAGGMTIRGLIAHNGIYNWTLFLPDHPMHKRSRPNQPHRHGHGLSLTPEEDHNPKFAFLKSNIPSLFPSPESLFDPFASPSLFFQPAPLHVPGDFHNPSEFNNPPADLEAIKAALSSSSSTPPSPSEPPSTISSTPSTPTTSPPPEVSGQQVEEKKEQTAEKILARATALAMSSRPPRKGFLVFPPRIGTLRIPDTLFLYDDIPESDHHLPSDGHTPEDLELQAQQHHAPRKNSFKLQATELATLMRRSVSWIECKKLAQKEGEESIWGVQEARDREAERRVQVSGVSLSSTETGNAGTREGTEGMEQDWGMGKEEEEEMVGLWLRKTMEHHRDGREEGPDTR